MTWEKPAKDAPIRMVKDYRIVPRGVALVIGCNTFPTWNAYPGIFASLVTGNPVIVKPHPRAVLPLAITVEIARNVVRDNGFDPALVQLRRRPTVRAWPRPSPSVPRSRSSTTPAGRGSAAGSSAKARPRSARLHREVRRQHDRRRLDRQPAWPLGNLAFSLALYSGQMCTTPQNIYVPEGGVDTDEGHLSFDEFGERLAGAIGRLTGDDARAVEILGATVNDQVRDNAAALD